ncbi:MAG: cytochrome bc complex cytochrome b subunit [Planctomycetes bacterium]|nr:cytochrome bc complex cytochrome b subunit [Planctomycetota bacterium]MBL7042452.1 cytochrome bc complex cytochrome b subunit [Pirellulaceae bacterium]
MSPAPPDDPGDRLSLKQRIRAFGFERLGLDVAQSLAAKKTVPIHRSTHFYFLGGMALFLFLVQIVTGALLSLYYKPSPDQAFESVRAIMTEVEFGWLIRSIHSWSANLLVGILFLHVLTTYMMRAYRRPREMTWLTGIALLGLFMAFGFSGYLLPWNELAFFATRVGTAIVGVVPIVGEKLLLVARGGENVTGDTLARFYSLHVVVFPLVTFALLGVHLFLVQKHGMSVPDRELPRNGRADQLPCMPFVPHFLLRDMVGWYLALGILAALAALFPWELGEKADPFASSPEGIKPEWYFLFMFQTLKELPHHVFGIDGKVFGVLFFGFCGLVVLAVPFLDLGATFRRILNVLAAAAVAFFIVMTAWSFFDSVRYQWILGLSMFVGMLVLLLPFVQRGGACHRAIYIAGAALLALLAAVVVWELLCRWGVL